MNRQGKKRKQVGENNKENKSSSSGEMDFESLNKKNKSRSFSPSSN